MLVIQVAGFIKVLHYNMEQNNVLYVLCIISFLNSRVKTQFFCVPKVSTFKAAV